MLENNIKKSLADEQLLSTLIKHEYEQLTYIDNDMDAIRNPKFTQEYYDSLKILYEKSVNNNIKLSDISSDMKKGIFKVLYNKPPKILSTCLINTNNEIKMGENWFDKLPKKEDGEDDMLDMAFEPNKFSRLSCQLTVCDKLEGMIVQLPEKQA